MMQQPAQPAVEEQQRLQQLDSSGLAAALSAAAGALGNAGWSAERPESELNRVPTVRARFAVHLLRLDLIISSGHSR